jgi:hypothetical protein
LPLFCKLLKFRRPLGAKFQAFGALFSDSSIEVPNQDAIIDAEK